MNNLLDNPEYEAEASELIEGVAHHLSQLEDSLETGDPPPELVNSMFRGAHSLKGMAGMLSWEETARLSHNLESTLDGMRLGKIALSQPALEALWSAVDCLQQFRRDKNENTDAAAAKVDLVLERLRDLGPTNKKPAAPKALQALGQEIVSVLTEYEEHRLHDNIAKNHGLVMVRSAFPIAHFDTGLHEIEAIIQPIGEIITKLPGSDAVDADSIAFDILAGVRVSFTELQRLLADHNVSVKQIWEPEHKTSTTGLANKKADLTLGQGEAMAQTVRVNIQKLDKLMNLAGELALAKAELDGTIANLVTHVHATPVINHLQKNVRQFSRHLRGLQDAIMGVRMVPIDNLFERTVRVIRKAARELGRALRVDQSGQSTELDKLLVEEIADPLLHIVRNAVDHGIEPPEERLRANKPREGILKLKAYPKGAHVVIEIEDDGRGLQKNKILRKAVEQKIISKERANSLNEREIFQLIFTPGFSTADTVSQVSGRGMGMDIVKTKLSHISGLVEVASREGQGTTITLTLPMTLAILRTLLVHIAGTVYALPVHHILEARLLRPEHLKSYGDQHVIIVRNTTMPFIDLAELFALPEHAKDSYRFAILVGMGRRRVAVGADALLGQRDIVIKPLGAKMGHVRGIAGATALGHFKTVLVLDVIELLQEAVAETTIPNTEVPLAT